MKSSRTSFRGGYAPRRGRGGWPKPFNQPREPNKPDIQKSPLGELLETFRYSDLKDHVEQPATNLEVSNTRYVASYNWLNSQSPTIMVPGQPPQWTPLQNTPRLKQDQGEYYRDPNAARFPDYPIAPAVKAIINTRPDFSTFDVDLVACGSTLGNLLRFARGIDRAFRFDVEVIGNSVFFIRKENNPKEIIPDVRGFGHSFPEAYTTWDEEVKGSETHQRIVEYDFADLHCLVRFECDGYLKTSSIDHVGTKRPRTNPARVDSHSDDFLDAFSKTQIAQKHEIINTGAKSFEVHVGGSEIPQNAIFDLKTRSGKHKREIDMTDIYPQLWIKQVPNFIIAYHDGEGKFEDIRVRDVRNEVRKWESDNAEGISRLAVLLRMIVTYAKTEKELLEIYCPGPDRLEIHKQFGAVKHALSDELSAEWLKTSENIEFWQSDSDDGGFKLNESIHLGSYWDTTLDDEEPDYTACSAEDCGYCGKCTY